MATKADTLKEIRAQLQRDEEVARPLTIAEENDLRFETGDQWDEKERSRRNRNRIPTLTFNRHLSFIGQVEGNRRLNSTDIKVVPDHGGSKEEALLREGILRNIQKNSLARDAYIGAFSSMIGCGVGAFKLGVYETDYDVFNKDIVIEPVYNVHSVIWDSESVEITGKDADHVNILEHFTEKRFEELWPGKQPADVMVNGFLDNLNRRIFSGETERRVRVATRWEMVEEDAVVALMQNLSVMDVTNIPESTWMPLAQRDQQGKPIFRETKKPFAEMITYSGADILSEPVRLPISRVPVFRMTGKERFVGDDRVRWGMVRFVKDPQRLHNYWRSAIARILQMSSVPPPIIAPDQAITGYEDQWTDPWSGQNKVLKYKADSANAPSIMQQPNINPALFNEAALNVQDMVDILDATPTAQFENQASGKAINARQQVASLGNVVYNQNADASMQECGRVINELIPYVYDANRMVTIMGRDETLDLVEINALSDPKAKITSNKYTVTATTGPSYVTRREEAREVLLTMMNHAPQIAALSMDKIVETLDIPEAETIARRIRKGLPAGVVGVEEMTDEEKQSAQGAQAAAQEEADFQKQSAQAELRHKVALAMEAEARAEKEQALAQKALSEVGVQATTADAEAEKDRATATKQLSEIGVSAKKADTDATKLTLDAMKQIEGETNVQNS